MSRWRLWKMAAATRIEETARRNHLNARNAYETVLYLLRNLKPNADQQNAINQKLADLKARLQAVAMFEEALSKLA